MFTPINANKLTFSEKISAIRKHFGYSQDILAEKIGVSGSSIGLIQQGKTKSPSAEMLGAMTRVLGINPGWLLTGEGPMLTSDATPEKKPSYIPRTDVRPVMTLGQIKVIELPHVSFKARASLGYVQLQRVTFSELIRQGIEEGIFDTLLFRLPPGRTEEDYRDALVFDIEGDSMEPSLRDGQQVIAWPVSQGKWEYLHNTICIVYYDELVTVKAIFKNDLNNTEGLTFHATGGIGGSFVVEAQDIHSIWEVREFYGIVPVRLLPS